MGCHPCSTDIHLSSLCLSLTTQNSILALFPGISLQIFNYYVTRMMTKILLLALLLHYTWPCYSCSRLLWCILPVTQTLRREPEMCQSLDPLYTRTVKLPFLSKKYATNHADLQLSAIFCCCCCKGNFCLIFLYTKILQASHCDLGVLLFFAPSQVSLLGKKLVLTLVPFTAYPSLETKTPASTGC